MNVTHDMSVLSLITGASVLVQLVMAGLLLCSVFSWYYIFVKIFTYRRASRSPTSSRRISGAAAISTSFFSARSIRATHRARSNAFSNRVSANSRN